MRPRVLLVEPLLYLLEERGRCLEDPGQEELLPWVPFPVERFPWYELSF